MGVHERTIHKEKGKATAVRSTVVLQEGPLVTVILFCTLFAGKSGQAKRWKSSGKQGYL